METPNTDLLIGVINRFKIIKRIDFDNDDHRKFVGEVFRACKEAKPEIEALKLLAVRPVPVLNVKSYDGQLTHPHGTMVVQQKDAVSAARKAATKGRTRLKVGGDGAGVNLESKIS